MRGGAAQPRLADTSAVFGTTSARSVISIRPAGLPPMDMSKKTTGFAFAVHIARVSTDGLAAAALKPRVRASRPRVPNMV